MVKTSVGTIWEAATRQVVADRRCVVIPREEAPATKTAVQSQGASRIE